jgi:hypothetical protein
MKESRDVLIENDKVNAPYLLAASFNGLIQFLGSEWSNGVLFLKFAPKEKAENLIEHFQMKSDPRLPAKDVFDAINVFWKQIAKKGSDHG